MCTCEERSGFCQYLGRRTTLWRIDRMGSIWSALACIIAAKSGVKHVSRGHRPTREAVYTHTRLACVAWITERCRLMNELHVKCPRAPLRPPSLGHPPPPPPSQRRTATRFAYASWPRCTLPFLTTSLIPRINDTTLFLSLPLWRFFGAAALRRIMRKTFLECF